MSVVQQELRSQGGSGRIPFWKAPIRAIVGFKQRLFYNKVFFGDSSNGEPSKNSIAGITGRLFDFARKLAHNAPNGWDRYLRPLRKVWGHLYRNSGMIFGATALCVTAAPVGLLGVAVAFIAASQIALSVKKVDWANRARRDWGIKIGRIFKNQEKDGNIIFNAIERAFYKHIGHADEASAVSAGVNIQQEFSNFKRESGVDGITKMIAPVVNGTALAPLFQLLFDINKERTFVPRTPQASLVTQEYYGGVRTNSPYGG